ncbi:hypothetical protein [Streptomyces sp. NBC_00370]|uniref:hypothetical protein n=1 Tax=Streptomyces sp. NBC_00370 TaxID=2975728 RepID=UPI002E272AB6
MTAETSAAQHLPPLIAEHDTWISVDPVTGCPADCAYCYLGPLGLRATRPVPRITPRRTAEEVHKFLHGRRAELIDPLEDPTPLCLGNYTDMLMTPENRRATVETLREISRTIRPRTTILITKSILREETVAEIDELEWPVVWFFSQSFARNAGIPLERGRISHFEDTLANARLISASKNQQAVHFWRPFVQELTPAPADMPFWVASLKNSGMRCSVLTGLRLGPGVPDDDPRLHTHLPDSMRAGLRTTQMFDQESWKEATRAGRHVGYPVYRNSSCALALVSEAREQLGTWNPAVFADRCTPCFCPADQRRRCLPIRPPNHEEGHNPTELCERLGRFLKINSDRISINEVKKYLYIEAAVSEFDYNTIMHAMRGRYVPVVQSTEWRRAWKSAWSTEARRRAGDDPTAPFRSVMP